jgi:hypothetical protein
MPGAPQRGPYPQTSQEAQGSQWRTAHAIHGAGDAGAYFKGAPKAPTPWPSAGRTKSDPRGYKPDLVQKALSNPGPHMREMDPRHLHATQPSVTSEGVNHYMGDDYRKTGRTFADQHVESNRFPVVYTDPQGRNKLLSGHHRATAALLQGRQLRAIHVREE